MFSSFFASKKWLLWAYLGLAFLLCSTYAQVQLMVEINAWYKGFYDMLQNVKNYKIDDFWGAISKFAMIAFPYVLIATITNYFTRVWTFKWREAMTFDYLCYWQKVQKDIEGSSQRIQEDIYRFAKILESLGSQIVDAIMTLIAFIPILLALSSQVQVTFMENVSGALVWIAVATSVGGLAISWFVGIMLPGLEYNNQKVEASFRKELVYAEDDKLNHGGTEKFTSLFNDLKYNYGRLFLHYGYFDVWRYSFSQGMVLIPLIAMAPSVLAGAISLGVMMQATNAFRQVHGSLSVFMNNWTVITELRSIHKRLKEFEENINYKK
ncbi:MULTISPECIES: putative transporter [unclassified Campylobacter]|uniref:putative transporter n=1 Tax=unclassified Campylobacter TaxID=2593542 RepID=UPI003D350F20